MEKITVFGYSRKSPDDVEDTKRSIGNQDELIKIICKGKNWNLKDILSDENLSGSDRERPGIIKQIKKAKEHKVSNPHEEVYIVVKDSKRLARDRSWLIDRIKDLNAYGVKVFSIVDNNFLDPSNLGYRIMADVDEQAIYDGQKNAKLTQQLKMSKNLPCIPAPFGYKYNKQKSWLIVKKESQIVLGVIQNHLNSVDYRAIMRDFGLSRGKYYRIIKNAQKGLYCGYCVFYNKIRDSNKKIIRTEEIKYKINCEKIISEELYIQVGRKAKQK